LQLSAIFPPVTNKQNYKEKKWWEQNKGREKTVREIMAKEVSGGQRRE
jgi:hypothetical protein